MSTQSFPAAGSQIDGAAPESFPGHDGGQWTPVPSEVVASWPAGHFAENLAVDAAGVVFVSLHSHQRIERFDPASATLETFAELPAPVAGLAFSDGSLWATGGVLGQSPGLVWRIDVDANVQEWVQIPDAVFLNGCAPHDASRGLLVCESVTGRVLLIDREKPRWRPWITDGLLRPESEQIPGANGIKLHDEAAWISVTDRDLLLRVPYDAEGEPGIIETAASDLRADDFAFASSGALYIATHPANTVLRLATDNARTTIAGPIEGAVGSTACAFGHAPGEETSLYVTTSGGLWAPYRGEIQTAKLLRLSVGESGEPRA